MLPDTVTCNDQSNGKNRRCGASAVYESENAAEGHAYYRCQEPECKALMVVCVNEEHVND